MNEYQKAVEKLACFINSSCIYANEKDKKEAIGYIDLLRKYTRDHSLVEDDLSEIIAGDE